MRQRLFCSIVVGLLAVPLLLSGVQSATAAGGDSGPGFGDNIALRPAGLSTPVAQTGDAGNPEGGDADLLTVFGTPAWPTGATGYIIFSAFENGDRTADDFICNDAVALVAVDIFYNYEGFATDPNDPGSDFWMFIWEDDGSGLLPTGPPIGSQIFESGPHDANDGVLTVTAEDTEVGGPASILRARFNFNSEFFVTEPGVKYWVGMSAIGPGGNRVGAAQSSEPHQAFEGMAQAFGEGSPWTAVDVSDPPVSTDMGMSLLSFAPTGGTTVVSLAGTSAGGGCPGGCCVKITPTTAPITTCDGGDCPTDSIFGPNCFAEVAFPAGLTADLMAQALKLAFDNNAGCNSDILTAANVGPRVIVTTTDGTKPKLCLSINGADIGLVGGAPNCAVSGCGYDYQVGPTVTLPAISAGSDRFTTVGEDCSLPLGDDTGTWIDLDVAGSLFDRAGLPAANAVSQRLRLSGVARDFAIDDSSMLIDREENAVFGRCSGDFSRAGDQGTSFSPDGVVNDDDVAAFDDNCNGQSEPFSGDCDFFDYNGDDTIDGDDRDVLLCLQVAGNTSECCPNRIDPGTQEPDLPQAASNIVSTNLARLHLRGCEGLSVTRTGLAQAENWVVDMYVSTAEPSVGASDIPPCEPGDGQGPNGNDIIENAIDVQLLAEGAARRIGGEIGNTEACDFAPLWPGDQDADMYRFTLAFETAIEITATGVEAAPECSGATGAVTSLWLYNDRGTRLANDDPAGAADPIIQDTLDAGEYFILVAAAGQVQEPLPEGFPPSFPNCSIAFAPEVDGGAVDPTGFYDLTMTVIPGSTMRITQTSATGGTYEARTLTQPVITYQKTCDPAHAVMVDTGGTGVDAFVLEGGGPWTSSLAEDTDKMPGDPNFVPGVDDGGAAPLIGMTEANGLGFAHRVQAAARRDCPSAFDTCEYAQAPDADETLDYVAARTSALASTPVADSFTVDAAVEIQSVTFWVSPAGVIDGDHQFDVRILGSTGGAGACSGGIPDTGNVFSDGVSGDPFVLPTALGDVDQITLNLLDAFTANPGTTYWVELSHNTAASPTGNVTLATSLDGDGVFFHDVNSNAGQAGDSSADCAPADGDGWDCDVSADDGETDCDETNADGDQRTDGNLAFCVGTTRAEILTKDLPGDVVAGSWRADPGAIAWTQPFVLRGDGTVGFFSDLSLGTTGGNQAADSFTFFSQTSVTGINWRGTYTSNNPNFDADTFRIEFWSDAAGLPDAQIPNGVFTPSNAEITRSPSTLSGDPGRQVYEYAYELPAPIVVAQDQTLWLSVINDTSGQSYNWAFSTSSGGNGDGRAALRAGLDENPPWESLPDSGDPPTDFSFDVTVAGTNPVICGDSVASPALGGTATGLGYRFDPQLCTINGFESDAAAGTRWRAVSAPWKMFEITAGNGATAADIGPLFAEMGVTLTQTQIDALASGLPEGALIDQVFTGTAAFDTDPDINGISLGGTISTTCNGAITESVDPTLALSQTLAVNGIMADDGSSTADVTPSGAAPPEILHQDGLPGQTRPHSGYVDPLQESDNSGVLEYGLTSANIRFTQPVNQCGGGDLDTSNFVMSETGGAAAPIVTLVEMLEPSYFRVTWDRFITLQEWTTIQAVGVCNAAGMPVVDLGDQGDVDEPDRVDLGYLPTDVNQSANVNPLDLLRFKQFVNGIATPDQGLVVDYIDTNRSGGINPLDLLRFKQGINGVIPPSTVSWAFKSINNPRP